jgi:putative transposase
VRRTAEWFGFYINARPHEALGSRTPMAVWREGISGGLPEMAVDITLRLNNAKALPTCPQQPQQIAA